MNLAILLSTDPYMVVRAVAIAIEVYYTLVSFTGILINIWTVIDSRIDLIKLRMAKINSLVEMTGRISYRDAVSIVFMHFLFFSIGVFGLVAPAPTRIPLSRLIVFLLYALFAAMAQTWVVIAQALNQRDRIFIRNQLIQEAKLEDAER